ncbi:signal peptidase II [Georgenia sp. Z1491]|uniref:signal peptidase II n=1 Tax=Georgenia sp. Z1491 TaxID=3416707 RepID=UPI003CEA2630
MTSAAPGASRRLPALLLGLAAAVAVIDQVTKAIALDQLADGRRIELLGEYLGLRLVFNPGAAFGLGSGTTWLFTVIIAVVVVVILFYARRLRSVPWAVALGLLLGGAVGNFIDRIFRDPGVFQGHVIDFIAYYNWFVGNVADIAIVVAASMICVLALLGREIDGTRLGDRSATDGSAAGDGASDERDGGSGTVGAGEADDAARTDPDWLVAASTGPGTPRADDEDPEAWWERRLAVGTGAGGTAGAAGEPAGAPEQHRSAEPEPDDSVLTADATTDRAGGGDAPDAGVGPGPEAEPRAGAETATTTGSATPGDRPMPAETLDAAPGERITRRELRRRREAAEAAARAARTDEPGA